ncbi:MAG: hypothetical protein GX998_05075 [Firmicutes bacterium]|nr:hypothetical protein [Bacillota bacterium]
MAVRGGTAKGGEDDLEQSGLIGFDTITILTYNEGEESLIHGRVDAVR